MAIQWPEGKRCVALFTVDFDGTGNELGRGETPVGSRSGGYYSARRGVPRLLEIFDRHGVPATFFVPGYDAEQNPDSIRSIVAAGHEVAAHGYQHESFMVPPDEEERLLRLSHQILSEVSGARPLGWRSPGGQKSSITLRVLRELGYIYDSSDKDYDLPYPASIQGQPTSEMVEIPNNTSSLDDFPLYVLGAQTPEEVLDLWKAEFDRIYNETGYFLLTFHPRPDFGTGLPSRARVIDRLMGYIQSFPDVHFSRMADLAQWCLDPAHGFLEPAQPIGGRP
jgi:peptidoglycan-N-acetylglucosamine deacetylase